MADEKKIGAYLCKGCGLGERLDINALKVVAEREGKAALVREHDFLCGETGVAMIQSDIDTQGVNRIAIGACSRRAKTEAFNFANVAMSRANLREGVIWVRPDTDEARETTQEMATDYVRMACVEVKFMNPPNANTTAVYNRNLLVVGGGISGLTSAIEAARAGYQVSIVEKGAALGGIAAQLYRHVPERAPYTTPEDTGISELIGAVKAHKNITLHTHSSITETDGAPGRFAVKITTESGTTVSKTFGAIIQATGFTAHDVSHLPEYGYKTSPDIITQFELEQLAKAAGGDIIKRPSDGKQVTSVAFVQCAGQRSDKEGHLPYCSGHCCTTSIKQALYFKNANPNIDTHIIYTDLRTPGAGGEDFYRSGQHQGVTFTKGSVSGVTAEGGEIAVKFKDLILNEEAEEKVDLVVLANGMVPNSGLNIDDPASAEKPKSASILNLTYRQGRDLPQLKYGFNDSHFICFPYETRRTGIYAAGPVRRPMDIVQTKEDATGAALKAIQAIENASQGRAAHPRSGDLSFPSFKKEGCTQCKRCTVECPFGAIDEDEKRFPVFNESRCRRCGTCMGACPVRVISFENYSVDSVGQQIKNIDIPEEFAEKPRILMFACENDAYPALDMAGLNRQQYSAFVRVIPVRCLGSLNLVWITDALNAGFDGVMLMGCKKGDNYQCHFVKGSELAHMRMSKVDDTLKTLSLETERVVTHEIAITDIQRLPQLINEMAETIQRIGMSPLKF